MTHAEINDGPRAGGESTKPAGKPLLLILLMLLLVSVGIVAAVGWFLVLIPARDAAEREAAARLLATKGVLVRGKPKVDSADFTSVAMTDELAQDISLLVNVKTLNLKESGTTDGQLATMMGQINPVSIVLNGTAVTDEGLRVLRGLSRIEALFLKDTVIGDGGAETIGTLTTLAELDLTGTQITSAGLQRFTRLRSLKRLILDDTAVDDQGLAALEPLKNLVRLEVRGTEVTAEGVSKLGQNVPGLLIEQ